MEKKENGCRVLPKCSSSMRNGGIKGDVKGEGK